MGGTSPQQKWRDWLAQRKRCQALSRVVLAIFTTSLAAIALPLLRFLSSHAHNRGTAYLANSPTAPPPLPLVLPSSSSLSSSLPSLSDIAAP